MSGRLKSRTGLVGLAFAMIAPLLEGCATAPPLRANWYQGSFVTASGETIREPLHLALQNYGTDPVNLAGVSLKDSPFESVGDFVVGTPAIRLLPGELIVIKLGNHDKVDDCMIPVRLYVRTQSKKKKGKAQPIIVGGLPTFLSDKLRGCTAKSNRDKQISSAALPSPPQQSDGSANPTPPPSLTPQ